MATGPLEPLAYLTATGEGIPQSLWTKHAVPEHKLWTVLFVDLNLFFPRDPGSIVLPRTPQYGFFLLQTIFVGSTVCFPC